MFKKAVGFKMVIITIIIILIAIISSYIVMRRNSYNIFKMNMPQKIPPGLKRINMLKKIPIEKDWVFSTTYENSKKQPVKFNQEPLRAIRCDPEKWRLNFSLFKPKGSSKGCAFYLENYRINKIVRLHWFLWNVNNTTYAIYDEESILTEQEAIDLAESLKPEIVIAKDLTRSQAKKP